MTDLIICEKPSASEKIAKALADGKISKKSEKGVAYYEISHKGKDIIVSCAVGHLYTLAETEKKKWAYPIFDVEWKESSKVGKAATYTKKYLDTIKKLGKDSDVIIIATDYDVEGEVIGLNIVKFACNRKDASRMKFSTLTKDELIDSYEHASKHLDWPQAEAGETRHYLDYFFGINLSRALTLAIKNSTGRFKLLSSGRVQGPALKILADKEHEILAFKSVPFWQIGVRTENEIIAMHEMGKFLEKGIAQQIFNKIKNNNAVVSKVFSGEFQQEPPHPFDLTAMQIEAYRTLRISPKETLTTAQNLYINGYISYPRTSSNQIPESIGYKKILYNISKNPKYSILAEELLKKQYLRPNNGKKTDPAHPAIYITSEIPKSLTGNEARLYDLIVHRLLATFSDNAVLETVSIHLDVNKEIFIAKGTTTKTPGWHKFYGHYFVLKEKELPFVEENQILKVIESKMLEKETQPPKRYTPASIIKELEKNSVGTKCLAEDSLVTIKSDMPKTVKISDLYEEGIKTGLTFQDAEISLNSHHQCISIRKGMAMESTFKLISKRKIGFNEQVFLLTFNDGSIIKATEEHPILCWDNNNFVYKKLKDMKPADKAVALFNNINKIGKVIVDWKDFLKVVDAKTKIYCKYDLRISRTCSQRKLAEKYGVTQSGIQSWEYKKQIPIWSCKKLNYKPNKILGAQNKQRIRNPFPLRMSSSLTRILANLIGDGSIDKQKIKRENCFDFRYHNTDINLINRFINDVYNVFGVKLKYNTKPTIKNRRQVYFVRIPSIIGRIIFLISPNVIEKGVSPLIYDEFYAEFLGAMFDDEGHTIKSEPKLFISNTNFKMLSKLKELLTNLKIRSLVNKRQYKLYIRGKENIAEFLQQIPILSFNKKKRLVEHLYNFYKYGSEKSQFLKEKEILVSISSKEKTSSEIAKIVNEQQFNIRKRLSKLIKRGFVKKEVIGISERPRKKILYSLKGDLHKTYYALVGEEVINPYFVTKTVSSIQPIKYDGYVYDITNSKNVPNFMLNNGVIIHNSTRAEVIDNLYQRNYIKNESIEVTGLGLKTIETLEKFCPEIIDVELTRKFENEMDQIREKKKKSEEILEEAKESLTKTLAHFKKNEKAIGLALSEANQETYNKEIFIGKCPVCKEGNIQIRRGKYGAFAACNRYEQGCSTTFNLPKNAMVKTAEKNCEICNYPKILAIKARRKPQELCINPNCEGKKQEEEKLRELIKDKTCPNCNSNLVVKSSVYGKFLACPQYPKCKHIEKINLN